MVAYMVNCMSAYKTEIHNVRTSVEPLNIKYGSVG